MGADSLYAYVNLPHSNGVAKRAAYLPMATNSPSLELGWMTYTGFEVRKIGSAEFLEEIIAKQRDQSIELLQKEEEVRSKNLNLEIEIARERSKVEQLEIELEKRAIEFKTLENTVAEQKETIQNLSDEAWELETRLVGSISVDELVDKSQHVNMSLGVDFKNAQKTDCSFLDKSPIKFGDSLVHREELSRYKISAFPHSSSEAVYVLTLSEFTPDSEVIQHFFFSVNPREMGMGYASIWIREIDDLNNGITITVKGDRVSIENNGAYKSNPNLSIIRDVFPHAGSGDEWIYLVRLHQSPPDKSKSFTVSSAYRPTLNGSHRTWLEEPKSWIFGLSS